MFECQRCLQRSLQALLGLQPGFSSHVSLRGARREFHKTPIQQQKTRQKAIVNRADPSRQHVKPQPRVRNGDFPASTPYSETLYRGFKSTPRVNELSQEKPSPLSPEDSTAETAQVTKPQDGLSRMQKRRLRIELQYLQDPKKLAEHVQYVLSRKDEAKALALVRLSSAKISNTVSWNHVIDHQMANGQTNAALSTFNEMKKRGQRPDSYTYMLLLRGLGQNVDSKRPTSLNKALSIYHSMSAKGVNASVNIMHTNAMLKVCSRAMDLSSMWDIVGQLPEKGPHAANSWTFTTMLNTMTKYASSLANAGKTEAEHEPDITKYIEDGRQLWNLAIKRWQEGDLIMDEDLVCAMGRLLLISPQDGDRKSILRLVHQTMGVATNPVSGSGTRVSDNDKDDVFAPSTASTYDVQSRLRRHSNHRSPTYAVPSNNTLSLLLSACTSLRAIDAGSSYWNTLTSTDAAMPASGARPAPKGAPVTPDMENVHAYLRLLLISHHSKLVSHLITQSLPEWNLKPQRKTFRVAMSACARDTHTNAAAGAHATALLDAMDAAPPDAHDVTTRAKYIELYTRVKPSSRIHAGSGSTPSSAAWTTAAILRNETAVRSAIAVSLPAITSAASGGKAKGLSLETERTPARDAAQLAQAVVSARTSMLRAKSSAGKLAAEQIKQQHGDHPTGTQARQAAVPASASHVSNTQRVEQLFKECVTFLKKLELVDPGLAAQVHGS